MTEEQRWPEPAYLTKDHAINMTLRDYFAAKVMQSIIAMEGAHPATAAGIAYTCADAMLKAREKK